MTCPDIYLGPSYDQAPPDPVWLNSAIQPPGGGNFTVGVAATIGVTVRNHGTDDAPSSFLELFWSDPTTGFVADPARLIGDVTLTDVPGAVTVPAPADGEVTHNFGWTPPATAAATNGGHVCLLARVEMAQPPGAPCIQQGWSLPPTTDPRSAIRNIHVYAPPPPAPSPGDAGGDGSDDKFMGFAFAATNILPDLDDTKLLIRPLDPRNTKDALALRALVADTAVHRALVHRRVKFATPNAVLVGAGRERVLLPDRALRRIPNLVRPIPQIQRTGPISTRLAKYVLNPGSRLVDAPIKPGNLKLLPGEMRQTLIQIEPRKGRDDVYAVNVEHHGADGRVIGGMVVVFVPPPNYLDVPHAPKPGGGRGKAAPAKRKAAPAKRRKAS